MSKPSSPHDDLTVEAASDEASRWLKSFLPSLEYLEDNASLSPEVQDHLQQLTSSLMRAKVYALLVQSELTRERALSRVEDLNTINNVATSPTLVHRRMLDWVRDGRVVLWDGHPSVLMGVLFEGRSSIFRGSKKRQDTHPYPLRPGLLDIYYELCDAGEILPAKRGTPARIIKW